MRSPSRHLHIRLTLPQAMFCLLLAGGLFLWSATITGYVVFRDDVLAGFVSRHISLQQSYEQRLAEARRSLAEIRANHANERAALMSRIDRLIDTQVELEQRQIAMARTLGIDLKQNDHADAPSARHDSRRPAPIAPAPIRSSALDDPGLITGSLGFFRRAATPVSPDERVEASEATLRQIEQHQAATLAAVAQDTADWRMKLQQVYSSLGIDIDPDSSAQGGPFIEAAASTYSFTEQLQDIHRERVEVTRLHEGLFELPLGAPLPSAKVTSEYGTRMDPFLRRPAFHSGLDFRARAGTPVHATGGGTVTHAGPNGGYGLMVEISHAHGYTTRYAHLSKISVAVGQEVRPGTLVGEAGSTGRSTGPHVHYETRRNDETLNPLGILEAGRLAKRTLFSN